MKFSLVMATLGRSVEVERLFDSLAAQTYRNFDLIVIDQNEDSRVRDLVTRFSDRMSIIYLRSAKGLSRARNVGLKHVFGDLVAFPDDDCWYPPDLLQFVVDHFSRDAQLEGLTGCSINERGVLSQGRWLSERVRVTRKNLFTCATSYTIFLRADAARLAGEFDEALGVGSGTRWGAGEETNYLLRVIDADRKVCYDPELRVRHPEPVVEMDERTYSRARLYNRGFGRVLGLNRFPAHTVLYHVGRAMAGGAVSLARLDVKRARYHWIAATQRFLGWVD
ncbi:glycosyltransferase family 2 protein [Niveibacterium sp. SC-1]|uniref:glycosyltransferase family 2 protein n=1 Tax=Niveibacterium sp. SC-1 TaxID=3135646 RepID=UPI00311D9F28